MRSYHRSWCGVSCLVSQPRNTIYLARLWVIHARSMAIGNFLLNSYFSHTDSNSTTGFRSSPFVSVLRLPTAGSQLTFLRTIHRARRVGPCPLSSCLVWFPPLLLLLFSVSVWPLVLQQTLPTRLPIQLVKVRLLSRASRPSTDLANFVV